MEPSEFINAWRSSLLSWGLGPNQLLTIGIVCLLAAVITFRELLSWFIKTDRLLKEMHNLKTEMRVLRAELLDQKRDEKMVIPDNFKTTVEVEKTEEPTSRLQLFRKNKSFRIFH